MVLTTSEILDELKANNIAITPLLDKKQIGPGSVDLRLSSRFLRFKHSELEAIDPWEPNRDLSQRYYESEVVPFGGRFVLHPGQFVLASTLEFIRLNERVAAQVSGRSSWGRAGLIIATAANVEPGFKGWITLELVNHGNAPIVLRPLVRIAQLVLYRTQGTPKIKKSKYYHAPLGTGISEDDEILGDWLIQSKKSPFIGLCGLPGSGQRSSIQVFKDRLGFKAINLADYCEVEEAKDIEVYEAKKNAFMKGKTYLITMAELDINDSLTIGDPLIVQGLSDKEELLRLRELGCHGFIYLDSTRESRDSRLKRVGISKQERSTLLSDDFAENAEECKRFCEEDSSSVVLDFSDLEQNIEGDIRDAVGKVLHFETFNV